MRLLWRIWSATIAIIKQVWSGFWTDMLDRRTRVGVSNVHIAISKVMKKGTRRITLRCTIWTRIQKVCDSDKYKILRNTAILNVLQIRCSILVWRKWELSTCPFVKCSEDTLPTRMHNSISKHVQLQSNVLDQRTLWNLCMKTALSEPAWLWDFHMVILMSWFSKWSMSGRLLIKKLFFFYKVLLFWVENRIGGPAGDVALLRRDLWERFN